MQKKILILGGNHVQMTAINAAKSQGYYVITADYLPDNPGHKLSDEYHNISTIDKDAMLKLARELHVDGVVSYASDVSAPTAAYIAEQLGLPTNPYDSVMVLTHKDLFRNFLAEHNYPVPKWAMFTDKNEAYNFISSSRDVWIIKPVDSSGSKGVSKITDCAHFDDAWNKAMKYSISKQVIIEQFIKRQGYQIDGDIFVKNGEVVFWGFCDQHNDIDCAPYVPVGLSFPSTQHERYQRRAKELVSSILQKLRMTMGAYNIEYIISDDDEVYILEIGPRNGGNLIPDTIYASTGYNMAVNTVRQAVGDECLNYTHNHKIKHCSSYIIHSQTCGLLDRVDIDADIEAKIIKKIMFVSAGTPINKFINGGEGIGVMVCEFDSAKQMCDTIDAMNQYVKVFVK